MNLVRSPAESVVLATSSTFDNSRYEQACDQAIAMCDGNLRSTIKALIMANEYLEVELQELQAAVAAPCAHTWRCRLLPALYPLPRAARGSRRRRRRLQ